MSDYVLPARGPDNSSSCCRSTPGTKCRETVSAGRRAAQLSSRIFRSSSRNRGSYLNPDYDALMDRYTVTIPVAERMGIMAQLIKLQTDLNLVMGLYFSVDAIMMANRLKNVPPASTWNVQDWVASG